MIADTKNTSLVNKLYTYGSLQESTDGVTFLLKNRLGKAELCGLHSVSLNKRKVPLRNIRLQLDNGRILRPEDLVHNPVEFPPFHTISFHCSGLDPRPWGKKNSIDIHFDLRPFGHDLHLQVQDDIVKHSARANVIPRDRADDYSQRIIKRRQTFVQDFTGRQLQHMTQYSFDPHSDSHNIENFTGIAQIPIGFAGPLRIRGEHANGEFIVPLATTEGTLVASYNRGMKILNQSGGVQCCVVEDAMQRAPVFIFDGARDARDFAQWVKQNYSTIAREAESTSHVAKLKSIDPYLASKMAFLRFNFSTGDAAGQNQVTSATAAACKWILSNHEAGTIQDFYLAAHMGTDKKSSRLNILKTRGKRVVAEATIPRDVLWRNARVDTERLQHFHTTACVGAMLSGVNNNGAHSANAIAAMFVATGQDIGNLAESSAGIYHSEMTTEKDLYVSITLPSLIVATYGGGTGLATQRECLELLGCYGKGKVRKLAEIVGGVVLAGEISLMAAIAADEFVMSHEHHGRNRSKL